MFDITPLSRVLSGRLVIACVGNDLRGDDGVGPLVAGLIRPSERASVVNCGETPENYLGAISNLKPDAVMIISAAGFGGTPGEIRVVARREIGGFGLSTLAPRLTIFTDYIEAETGAETVFVAVQPASLEFGERVGPEVAAAGRELARAISEAIAS